MFFWNRGSGGSCGFWSALLRAVVALLGRASGPGLKRSLLRFLALVALVALVAFVLLFESFLRTFCVLLGNRGSSGSGGSCGCFCAGGVRRRKNHCPKSSPRDKNHCPNSMLGLGPPGSPNVSSETAVSGAFRRRRRASCRRRVIASSHGTPPDPSKSAPTRACLCP